MKYLATLGIGLVLVFAFQALAVTNPALGLLCPDTDTDFKFEMVINQFTGDLFPGTVIISENNKQISSTINYSGRATKYIANPPGTRSEQDDSYARLE